MLAGKPAQTSRHGQQQQSMQQQPRRLEIAAARRATLEKPVTTNESALACVWGGYATRRGDVHAGEHS